MAKLTSELVSDPDVDGNILMASVDENAQLTLKIVNQLGEDLASFKVADQKVALTARLVQAMLSIKTSADAAKG